MAAPIALLSPGGGSGPAAVPDGIPAAFVPVYRESARAFHLDWLLLAAVHQQETGFSTNPTTYHGLNAAGCCAGPFQFNVTNGPPSTWDSHRLAYRRGARPADYPHPQLPHPSVYDDFDAAMAAGALLRGNGADATLGPRTFQAVRAYNGAGPVAEAYARRVIDRARLWQTTSPPTPSGAAARSPHVRRADVAGARTDHLAVLRTPRLGGLPPRHRHRRPDRHTDPRRRHRPRHDPRAGLGLRALHLPAAPTAPADLLRAPVAPRTHPQRRHRPARRLVGYVGCTGRCFGAHLHFEVRVNDQPVDPLPYLTGTR